MAQPKHVVSGLFSSITDRDLIVNKTGKYFVYVKFTTAIIIDNRSPMGIWSTSRRRVGREVR